MDRREFSKLAFSGVVLLGVGGLAPLAGCSSNLSDTTSLEDKTAKKDRDRKATSDEPTITLRVGAVESMAAALPALQEAYSKQHPNIKFDAPHFEPTANLSALMNDPELIGVIVDDGAALTQAIADGKTDESMRSFPFVSRVCVVASPGFKPNVSKIDDINDNSIKRIIVGDPACVYSGIFANQYLADAELYSDANGENGAYATEIADRVSIVSSLQEMVDAVNGASDAVALMLSSEAAAFGLNKVCELQRKVTIRISYQAAPFTGHERFAFGMDFFTFINNDDEAERVEDSFGLPKQ